MKAKALTAPIMTATTGIALWRANGIDILAVMGLLAGVTLLLEARARRRAAILAAKFAAWPSLLEYIVSAIESGLPLYEAVIEGVDYFDGEIRELLVALRRRVMDGESVAEALLGEKAWHSFGPFTELTIQLQAFEYCGAPGLAADLRSAAARVRAEASLDAELSSRLTWLMATVRMAMVAPWLMIAVLAQRFEARAAYQAPVGSLLLWIGAAMCCFAYWLIKKHRLFERPVADLWQLA